jgi:hypothetical protein
LITEWIARAMLGPDAPPRDILPISAPLPVGLKVAYAGPYTVIARSWAPGDAERCGLCPKAECHPEGGFCMVRVPEVVPPAKLGRFSLIEWRRRREGGAR